MPTATSVLIPVKNGARWLASALESISAQTHRPAEIIVVDDGSTDESMGIVGRATLPGLRVVVGPGAGLAAALNTGLAASTCEFVARIDQDDVSDPHRIELQSRLLDQRPDLVMCGTWARIDRPWGRPRVFRPPTDMEGIRRYLCLGNPFVHSSVMFRRDAVLQAGGYRAPSADPYPEDYDLWTRLSRVGGLANINQALVIYREHAGGVSTTSRDSIGRSAVELAVENLETVTGASASPADLAVLRAFHRVSGGHDSFSLADARSFLRKVETDERGRRHRCVPRSTRWRLYSASLERRSWMNS